MQAVVLESLGRWIDQSTQERISPTGFMYVSSPTRLSIVKIQVTSLKLTRNPVTFFVFNVVLPIEQFFGVD